MGKTPKPLNILVIGDILERWDEFKELASQGHQVAYWSGYNMLTTYFEFGPDLILGERCWFMDEQHRKYLDLAITEARRRRYPKEIKNE